MNLIDWIRPWARNPFRAKRIHDLYVEKDYLDAYSAHTDLKVEKDPHGPEWDEMGQHQLKFLVSEGLRPEHTLFDIGCGTLRAGRFFIEYLDAGHYTGTDISPKAIAFCRKYVETNGLSAKSPSLFVNEEKRLLFNQVSGRTFDFILAQSVFSHLPDVLIAECFANVRKIMHDRSRFYCTYVRDTDKKQIGIKSFSFPESFFSNLCAENNLQMKDLSKEYPHRNQTMLCVWPSSS
ncbi:MAG: class I SAM-dependent methyltransferase [Parvibaculaceae bacterium]